MKKSAEIEKMYDEIVAEHYDHDSFKLFSDSREIAKKQVKANKKEINAILDIGCGSGETLFAIHEMFPQAELYGIDISAKMLENAKLKARRKRIEAKFFHDDANNIQKYAEPNSFDLIFMHYVLNYIDLKVLSSVKRLLRKDGMVSITTHPHDNFSLIQEMIGHFISEDFIYNTASAALQQGESFINTLEDKEFQIFDQYFFEKELNFASAEELYDWGLKSGWLTAWIREFSDEQIQLMPLAEEFFPMKDKFKALIILATTTDV